MPSTSFRRAPPIDHDNAAIALRVLAWTLGDDARAARLLDLTGLDPAGLRARAGDADLLAAAIGFVAAHEPDLLACAAALALPPEAILAAGEALAT